MNSIYLHHHNGFIMTVEEKLKSEGFKKGSFIREVEKLFNRNL